MTNTGHLLTGRWSVLISAYTLCKLILRRASTLSISQIVSVILNTDIQEWHLQRIYLIPTWYAAHTTCKYAFHTSKLFMYRITSTGIFLECFLNNRLQLWSYRRSVDDGTKVKPATLSLGRRHNSHRNNFPWNSEHMWLKSWDLV